MVQIEMHLARRILLVFILICNCSSLRSEFLSDPVSLVQNIAENTVVNQNLNQFSNEQINDELSKIYRYLNETLNPLLVEFIGNQGSSKCAEDVFYLLESLGSFGGWATKMVDSYGKPGSGILQGNIRWVGEYEECINVYAPPKENSTAGDFHGKYCTVQMTLNVGQVGFPITLGACLPDSCHPSSSDANGLLNLTDDFPFIHNKIESLLNITTLKCQPTTRSLTSGAIAMIFVISLFAVLATIGTAITSYEYYFEIRVKKRPTFVPIMNEKEAAINWDLEQQHSQTGSTEQLVPQQDQLPGWLGKCKPFFNCFCFITNGEKLLNIESTEGQLPCLHGIRFLSMSWVMVCHAYAFSFTFARNGTEILSLIDAWPFQIILNGFYSVDAFFLLSGFLVAYLFFQEKAKKDGKIPWVFFYVHRYIRLTPVYMAVVGFYTTLRFYFGSGPMWTTTPTEQLCSSYWWWNMLYINNFQDSTEQCMGWSWYLSNDMQFYIVSPLFLITLWRWPKVGFVMLGLFSTISFITNFALTYHYNLFTGLGNVMELLKDIPSFLNSWAIFFDKIYTKPYTRITPYLVGIAVAYWIFKMKQNNYRKLKWIELFLGWTITSGITLACLFGTYHTTISVVEASFYNALNRTGFALGLGWVIFVCVIGQGGPVNSFLSWKQFIPVSRLTFCAYLVHPIIIMGYYASMKTMLEFTHITIVISFLGCIVISYVTAFVTSLLFESPLIRLEKLIVSQFRPKRPSD